MDKKTIAYCLLFLLLGMTISVADVSLTEGVFWSRIDGTVVLTNETENVNIGQNATTIYKLHVNGTSYFVGVMIVNDIIIAYGGNSTEWNLAYTWGDHSIVGYLTGWDDGDPFYNNSDAYHVTYILMDEWNQSYDWGDHSLVGYLMDWSDGDPFYNNSDAYHVTSILMDEWNQSYDWGDHSLAGYLIDWSDGDPFYNNSDAFYVTCALMLEWNLSYTWGDHSLIGYLMDWSDGDPFFNISDAWYVTSALMLQWNESYSWGDHSLMGYLTEGEQGFWNRTDSTLYTATDNDNVQVNATLIVDKINLRNETKSWDMYTNETGVMIWEWV